MNCTKIASPGVLPIGCLRMARAAALVLVCASSVGIAAEAEDSGFLSDYSRLEKTRDSQGKTVRRWVSPELTPANYRAVLIDPVAFYPEPQPSEQVSAKTLEDIRAHLDKVLRETLGASVAIVEQPGAGVVRMRFALTAVATRNAGLKPYQYMPTALVLTTVKRLATDTPQKATLVNEVELTDSLSNERLGAQVREITGERLKKNAAGESEVSLAAIEAAIDEATKASAGDVDKYIAAK